MIFQNSKHHSKVQLIISSKFQKFNKSLKNLSKQRLNEIINNHFLTKHKIYLNLILLLQIMNIIIENINVL